MFVLFAIFMAANGSIATSTAEFTSLEKCQEAQAALDRYIPTANKSIVCTAK